MRFLCLLLVCFACSDKVTEFPDIQSVQFQFTDSLELIFPDSIREDIIEGYGKMYPDHLENYCITVRNKKPYMVTSQGVRLFEFGDYGSGPGEYGKYFNSFYSDSALYISDAQLKKIIKFYYNNPLIYKEINYKKSFKESFLFVQNIESKNNELYLQTGTFPHDSNYSTISLHQMTKNHEFKTLFQFKDPVITINRNDVFYMDQDHESKYIIGNDFICLLRDFDYQLELYDLEMKFIKKIQQKAIQRNRPLDNTSDMDEIGQLINEKKSKVLQDIKDISIDKEGRIWAELSYTKKTYDIYSTKMELIGRFDGFKFKRFLYFDRNAYVVITEDGRIMKYKYQLQI